jgi:hypothetical protein
MSVSIKTKAILLTAVVLALLLATIIGIAYFYRIPSTGTIKAVGCAVYWDSNLTKPVTTIKWGICEPGKEYNRSVYIKNTSNVATNLTLGTENWDPTTASDYVTLYWNYDNHTLAVNEVIPVVLTLAIAGDITGITNFSFTIVIIAVG